MLRQQRIGQGKIGFEFANAGLIDQGRQRFVKGQYADSSKQLAVGIKLGVNANGSWQTANKKILK
jgi:hypothetical protein